MRTQIVYACTYRNGRYRIWLQRHASLCKAESQLTGLVISSVRGVVVYDPRTPTPSPGDRVTGLCGVRIDLV